MSLNVDEAIKQLSENMRVALQTGEIVIAVKIQEKINQLIEYSTKIPA